MKLTTNWHCPVCEEIVPIALDAQQSTTRNRVSLRVRVPEGALADAFAHIWTHEEPAS